MDSTKQRWTAKIRPEMVFYKVDGLRVQVIDCPFSIYIDFLFNCSECWERVAWDCEPFYNIVPFETISSQCFYRQLGQFSASTFVKK
jgi:hypothetical protein